MLPQLMDKIVQKIYKHLRLRTDKRILNRVCKINSFLVKETDPTLINNPFKILKDNKKVLI